LNLHLILQCTLSSPGRLNQHGLWDRVAVKRCAIGPGSSARLNSTRRDKNLGKNQIPRANRTAGRAGQSPHRDTSYDQIWSRSRRVDVPTQPTRKLMYVTRESRDCLVIGKSRFNVKFQMKTTRVTESQCERLKEWHGAETRNDN